jgi:hypothetical protein
MKRVFINVIFPTFQRVDLEFRKCGWTAGETDQGFIGRRSSFFGGFVSSFHTKGTTVSRGPRNSALDVLSLGEQLKEGVSEEDGSQLRGMGTAVENFLDSQRGVRENADLFDERRWKYFLFDPWGGVGQGEHLGVVVGCAFRKGNRGAEDNATLVVSNYAISCARVHLGAVSEDDKLQRILERVDEEDVMFQDQRSTTISRTRVASKKRCFVKGWHLEVNA